ncbi:hypothetical protein BGZ47_000740, partial [Haplosporangium gracile]
IHEKENVYLDASGSLHDYLCSSPHPLHLKSLTLPYSLDHMDLRRLLPSIVPDPSSRHLPEAEVYPPEI